MKLLIDAHALIWWWDKDPRLSARARVALTDRRNAVYVSAATGWEIATKFRSGRLPNMAGRILRFNDALADDGFVGLSVEPRHGVRGGLLEGDHRDPFDRLIAAQALIEGLTVVTCDREIAAFGCKVLW